MDGNELDLLIVEDEPDTRALLSQIFTMKGYTVRVASEGFSALSLMRARTPAMVLSDLNMPGMTGFELLSIVRRLYPLTYVVASSGAYSGTDVPRGIAADGFHEKATGMSPLLALMQVGAKRTPAWCPSDRTTTPLWVNLEADSAVEHGHVLLHCPACLRPFRQAVEKVNADIQRVACRHCGETVDYAVAFAINPPLAKENCACHKTMALQP